MKNLFLALIFATSMLFNLSCYAALSNNVSTDNFDGRDVLVYVPSRLPPQGARALVIVLHGGMGNAQRIEQKRSENAMNMDAIAEQNGFIVAYLNGTPVTRIFGRDKLGWNAGGGCCGQSAANNIDDVGYITGAVNFLAEKYGIDTKRVYAIGHSNGAMMTQRLMCETNVLAAGIAISGPLNLSTDSCPAAQGKHILGIHGADDKNVPVNGGKGTEGLSKTAYNSEERTRQVYVNSGASYDLDIVPGADHYLNDIDDVIQKTEGQSIAQKTARFFGLLNRNP